MPYSIILSDIDDTLLNDRLKVGKIDKKIISILERISFPFVLSSGRPTCSILKIAKKIFTNFDSHYAISYNGAEVTSLKENKTLFRVPLSISQATQLAAIGSEYGITVQIYKENHFCISKKTKEAQSYYQKTGVPFKVIPTIFSNIDWEPSKIIFNAKHELLEKVYPITSKLFKDQLNQVYSKPNYLEFFNKDVSKGVALQFICNHLNIPINESIAVGDSYNDIEMIKSAGLGLAVKNALPPVQEVAKLVLNATNNDNPLYEIVSRFVPEALGK